MPWAVQAGLPPYEGVHTDMSAGGLTVLAIVAVICLGFLLIPVMLAGRDHPQHRRPDRPAAEGPPVIGGTHRGDPRSVAPHRDEPAESAEPVPRGSGGDER
jgi:hypothetical protein